MTWIALDLDGTVADSMGALERLAVGALRRHHGEAPERARRAYRATVGRPFLDQLEAMHPGDPRNAAAARDFAEAKAALYYGQAPFPGVLQALHATVARGVPLYLVTSTARELAAGYASVHGLPLWLPPRGDKAAQLRALAEADPVGVFIGDAPYDAQVATAAGVGFVGVATTFPEEAFPPPVPVYPSTVAALGHLAILRDGVTP